MCYSSSVSPLNLLFNLLYLHIFYLTLLFLIFSDIVAVPTLKQYMYECTKLQCKLHIMQTTYLTLLSCPSLSEDTLINGRKTLLILLGRYMHVQENNEVSFSGVVVGDGGGRRRKEKEGEGGRDFLFC